MADFVLPAAGAHGAPDGRTRNYGATDSIVGGERAMLADVRAPDRLRRSGSELGLACGQTEEDVAVARARGRGLLPRPRRRWASPSADYNDFVARFRMYYPPLQYQNKYLQKGQFCTAFGQGRAASARSCEELRHCRRSRSTSDRAENEIDDPEVAAEYPIVLTTGGGFMPFHHSEHFNIPDHPLHQARSVLHHPSRPRPHAGHRRWATGAGSRRAAAASRCAPTSSPGIDPRAVYTQRGWWFPERSPVRPRALSAASSPTPTCSPRLTTSTAIR